ncbi:protein-L-isoaspartate(D-aspartate) O-methyltransferase [Sphaerisporangium rubeum]|uniref:Protein-L-isoaspartate O-methyltransferase n=1 Tax=Sphaerisporangium rubeum TaxID=321317 RepID=A0A7X0IHV1_9ACTN|nr:methyltransferase domain-containing protein [Sphaerisporangium rubeum]MBB6475515.1 protein-L-isoaspartate(D-aspartate) O-methyltransferase [Sphaerisporangium rubeum]
MDDRWRGALHAVPRHLFIPDRAWCDSEGPGHLIDRETDPDAWLDAVYSNTAIVTQLDDGATDIAEGKGDYTSSSSAPSAVAATLGLLKPYEGDEVLEIGTGTGWTAALLSHRLGDDNVTSIEIDRSVHATAAANLATAGRSPHLILGDGSAGHPEGAPYDQIHVTCGIDQVPYAWIPQTRPGGRIVFPWTPRWEEAGHLTVLTPTGTGTATGRFHGRAGFMPLRSQRWPLPRLNTDYRSSSTTLDPRRVLRTSYGADIAIAAQLPHVYATHADQENGAFHLSLWSDDSDAQVHYSPRHKRVAVLQRGPHDLWDEVEDAYLRWVSWGTPTKDHFGMTVTPEGRHIWLHHPANPITPPPQCTSYFSNTHLGNKSTTESKRSS